MNSKLVTRKGFIFLWSCCKINFKFLWATNIDKCWAYSFDRFNQSIWDEGKNSNDAEQNDCTDKCNRLCCNKFQVEILLNFPQTTKLTFFIRKPRKNHQQDGCDEVQHHMPPSDDEPAEWEIKSAQKLVDLNHFDSDCRLDVWILPKALRDCSCLQNSFPLYLFKWHTLITSHAMPKFVVQKNCSEFVKYRTGCASTFLCPRSSCGVNR